ncbi:hypothetical protein U9M48_007933 [Paspalum notatum var. saurae]|uniref:RING-type E3 ubiquitin transferase n=1 Tax=Paspalum notatum var. saurae TaxID=547442 RepID=A0AAQ3SNG8_PASNO
MHLHPELLLIALALVCLLPKVTSQLGTWKMAPRSDAGNEQKRDSSASALLEKTPYFEGAEISISAKKLQEYLVKELKRSKGFEEARTADQHLIQKLKMEIELLKIQRDEYLENFRQASEQILLQPSGAAKEVYEKDKHEMEIPSEEISQLKIHRDEYLVKFQKKNEPKLAPVYCPSDTNCDTSVIENDLEAHRDTIDNRMRLGRDSAVRYSEGHTQFNLAELKLATENFSESLKIGEGGFGRVYKGTICDTPVAIKILRHNENLQGFLQFQREVLILTKVRHPHLVNLLGACDEVSVLVYDYLPNGSLEDRLSCKGNTPALTWQVRTRITGEICSTLIFLHSHKPKPAHEAHVLYLYHPWSMCVRPMCWPMYSIYTTLLRLGNSQSTHSNTVVHGDLKPSNILLDVDLVSKLGDFGIARFLVASDTSTTVHITDHPIGTMFYSDPEYMAHGALTPGSDIFSFGIVILRLLTGRHPREIVKIVEDVMINDELHTIIDSSAGEWPFVQAQQLARIGMRCAAEKRRRRTDLVTDVWPVVEPMMKRASLSACPSTPSSVQDESSVPHYFLCPILHVFVAVPEQHKSGRSLLAWTLRHVAAVAGAAVVVAHVHAPAQMIPMSTYKLTSCNLILYLPVGSKFHASKLIPEQVSAYRQYEREKVEKQLDEYIQQCSKMKVKCEKLVIENDNVARGITELVSLHGVSKLIMGAAADKHYSRKMKMPKSKTALAVLQKAHTSCKIWFICKEHLIYTREAGAPVSHNAASTPVSRSSRSTLSEGGGQLNGYASNAVDGQIQRSMSEKVVPTSVRTSLRLPSRLSVRTTLSKLSIDDNSSNSWDSIPRGSFPSSHQASSTVTDEGFSDSSPIATPRHDGPSVSSVHVGRDLQNPASYHEQDAMNSNINIFGTLKEAFTEAVKHQKQVFDESARRQQAEEEPILFRRKANDFEDMSLNEDKQRNQIKEALAKANDVIEQMKREIDALKQDRDGIIDKLVEMSELNATLKQQVDEYSGIVKNLEDVLTASKSLIHSQKLEYEKLTYERDKALKDADDLRKEKEKIVSCPSLTWNAEFSLSELQLATQNFSDTMKIGEGGFGRVYRGFLRNTTVAIKMLRSHNLQGLSQFRQEVVVLSRVRHPNLVTLMGSCSEASGLVYEFLPNGSLEDRLACEDNTPPLTWQIRTRIIGEICSALVFLHSNKPHPVIHGDLKPANILLDANLVSKLSDFGISCLLVKSSTMSTSLYQTTNPRGTFAYMDPEFLTTGELTARSDIYSLGIVILQLVTGKPALGIGRAVEDALEKDKLDLLVDQSAGEWPFVQAKKLMLLGLQCAELNRRRRPCRMTDVWCVIEPMVKSASLSTTLQSFGNRFVESYTPSCFLCPITQEVMRNPHIAADGYTYEAEAIKGWLHSGRSTSPMTKLPLAHHHLIPNHALHSAIQEHLKHQQKPAS